MTGTRQKINSHSQSVLRLRVCIFFFFKFKLVTKLQFNCVHITKLLRLTFEFFFVEFPSVADGKTVRTFLLNRSLICRQRSKVNRNGTQIFIQDFHKKLTCLLAHSAGQKLKNPSKRKTGFQDQSLYIYIYIYLFIYSLTVGRLRNLFYNQSSEVIEVNNVFQLRG